jgi:hypothetical protein
MKRFEQGHDRSGEDEEMDRMLLREDEILPSAGFTSSVMDAVWREAKAPAPIPFPWKRALPGMIVAAVVLVVILGAGIAAVAYFGTVAGPQVEAAVPSSSLFLTSALQPGLQNAVLWIVLALVTALVSVKVSMRLGAGRA